MWQVQSPQQMGNICATPRHHLDLHPEKETTNQWTDTGQSLAIEEEGTSTRKVRKTHTIVVKISQNHNSSSKMHAMNSLP